MAISGKTQVCAVIGDPIEHTLSPTMHNAAFNHLNLDYVFLAFQVTAAGLEDAMRGVRGLGIRGLNVTMPHKNAVIAYLDEVEETAKSLGSVNSILNQKGRLIGFSTDGAGALRALKENGVNLRGKKLVVFGAGGAAKAVVYALAKEVGELVLLNRTAEKTRTQADWLSQEFQKKVTGGPLEPAVIQKSLEDADILINATSTGMHPNVDQSLVNLEWLKPNHCVMDIVYNPLETKLAKDAKAAGAKVISGVEMLIYQGAASFEIWTGHKAPVEIMREAVLKQLSAGETR